MSEKNLYGEPHSLQYEHNQEIKISDDEKLIVGQFTVKILIPVPKDWDGHSIHFKYNHEGTWCIDNFFEAFYEAIQKNSKRDTGCCFSCGCTEFLFVQDADYDDLEYYPIIEI